MCLCYYHYVITTVVSCNVLIHYNHFRKTIVFVDYVMSCKFERAVDGERERERVMEGREQAIWREVWVGYSQ